MLQRHQRHAIDGKSLAPIIHSNEAASAHDAFHWKTTGSTAMRKGRWKLIYSNKTAELFDLPNDISEAHNLAGERPELVEQLKQESRAYWARFMNNAPAH